MKCKREVSRKTLLTLHFEMMIFMLVLAFAREIAGATFFHQYYKTGNRTLECSRLPSKSDTNYVWYRGRRPSSLEEFEWIESNQNKISDLQCRVHLSSPYKEKTLPMPAFSDGGIFACTHLTENLTCPLFSDLSHCHNFDFFIVAIRNNTEEEKAFGNITDRSEHRMAITERDNFTLTCELQIKLSSRQLTLYWIKETDPSLCLFSASNADSHGSKFSEDTNCCVDAAIKERCTVNLMNDSGEWIRNNLTIFNASSSDSGTYLCMVTIWTSKHVWIIANNVSIEVTNSTLLQYSPTNKLHISLGAVGGGIFICGLIWLLCWKKKAKGNAVEERPRNQAEIEMERDDCSPYAVTSRKDIEKNKTTYFVLTYPPELLQGPSTLLDGKPASESGEKLHTVYALVSK